MTKAKTKKSTSAPDAATTPSTKPEVVVTKRPMTEADVLTSTRFPDDLLLYFRARNRNLRWGAVHDDQQHRAQSLGFEPVHVTDLPDELQSLCRRYRIHEDGTITTGDLILQSRSAEDQERQRVMEAEARHALESDDLPEPGQIGDYQVEYQTPPGASPGIGASILGPRDALNAGLVPDNMELVKKVLQKNQAKLGAGT